MTDYARRFSLAGHLALITGASDGLGAGFARILHEAGAGVILAARRTERLEALAAELGERAWAFALDVRDPAAIAACFAALDQAGLRPDILINNAGIARPRRALEIEAQEWDEVLEVNLRGAFLVAQEVARRLVAAGEGGSIVNIASILGLRVAQEVASYNAAKAALIHLTRSLAVEWARHAIRVNAIAPGYIETEMNRAFFATEAGKAMIKRIPMRRLGALEDLAGPLLLLASPAGAFMTGSVVVVDGGHAVNPV
jgi:NAD(P)-dependent dehydrogenase (short-subunit alcohol dehydrogenase family)